MKPLQTPLIKACSGVLAASFLATSAASAATANSVPLGYVTYTCLGNSDTRITLPVHRKEAFTGKVASVGGAGSNEITVQNDPGWAVDLFVYSAGVQPNTYFVMIGDGGLEGAWYEVTANDNDTLTVDLAGDTITGDVVADTQIKVIPNWTLATAFPQQAGIHESTAIAVSSAPTEVHVPDTTTAGVDLGAGDVFFYYSGGGFQGPGWRRAGSPLTTKFDDEPIAPDSPLVVRHKIATNTEVTPMGTVFTAKFRTPLNLLAPDTDQDNAVAPTIPVPLTLAESLLFESGAVIGNPTIASSAGDQVLVFDNAAVGQDKGAERVFFYYTGAGFTGPGWREVGEPLNMKKDNEVIFDLNYGVIIRKKGGAVGTDEWCVAAPYLPLLQ